MKLWGLNHSRHILQLGGNKQFHSLILSKLRLVVNSTLLHCTVVIGGKKMFLLFSSLRKL